MRQPLQNLQRLWRDKRGNVLMMFGFAVIPLTFAVGMGVDYSRAMKVQTKLDAIADAAALVAVSKPELSKTDAQAKIDATTMFMTQAQPLINAGHLTLDSLTITAPTDSTGRRTATVTYVAESGNVFAKILGLQNLQTHGVSQTTNAAAPNIDFYMLLDVSSSMALPTTTAGLAQVAASNSSQCQFACHSANDLKGKDINGNLTDLYGVATSYGLTLRIGAEGTAVSQLTSDAQSTQSKNGATYRMAINSFTGTGGFKSLQSLTTNLTQASTVTTALTPPLFYTNNCPSQACPVTDIGYGDMDTASSDAFTHMNVLMPTPGTGLANSTPQQVMFIITDGMRDEFRPGGRPEIAIDPTLCTTIKNRGTRIAVLYTEYLPQSLANDSWSQTNVAPYLSQVEPALKSCASPGLYTKVSTDQDIYAALDTLFRNAVATARITT